MIVGNGMIANRFKGVYEHSPSIVIFASGVSDSGEANETAYKREFEMVEAVIRQHPEKTFVYFSTYSVIDEKLSGKPYIRHKLNVEKYIANYCKKWIIVRAGNIVGKAGNSKTIFNYYRKNIQHGEQFELWEEVSRNFLDVDDLFALLDLYIRQDKCNELVYMVNPFPIPVSMVVKAMEAKMNVNANYVLIKKGSYLHPPSSQVLDLNTVCNIDFSPEVYIQKLITKYMD